MDPLNEEELKISLDFKVFEDQNAPFQHRIHRNILYSQSPYFRERLRPDGELFKMMEADVINANVSEKACQGLTDLIYGRDLPIDFDWKTLAQMVELSKILGFPYAKELIKMMRQFFDLDLISFDDADEMLIGAIQLEDNETIAIYENRLIGCLKSKGLVPQIMQIAKNRGLNHLIAEFETEEVAFLKQIE